jgi:hypothetical protein
MSLSVLCVSVPLWFPFRLDFPLPVGLPWRVATICLTLSGGVA